MNNTCPFCQGRIVNTCRCLKADSKCVNGHVFHRCIKHPQYIVDAPVDHEDMSKCSCVVGKTFALTLTPVS